MEEPAAAGRGRRRGRRRGQQAQQPEPEPQPPSVTAPPVQEMGALSVGGNAGAGRDADESKDGDRTIGRYEVRRGGLVSKKGSSGMKATFETNAFALTKKPTFTLNKYHVDFNPAEERTYVRKLFLREHREKLGFYLFDGSTIFSSHNLTPNKKATVEFFSKRSSDNENIRITIKNVGTIRENDENSGETEGTYYQVLNIIFRECLKRMKLTQIKRNFYDKDARIVIPEHNLELWPGYITSMNQFERDMIFQVEIIHKTLRKDTAYDVFREITNSPATRSFKETFSTTIIGTTVMTTYNDKTYRVDDVTYNETPKNTFKIKTRDGERHISYKDYYQQKYNAVIKDPNQPMLISKTNARERRAGMPELVYLVPELCVMTGLNDNMRNNYTLMKKVADHTSIVPSDRIRRLEQWRERLMSIPEVKTKLENWGLGLSKQLVQIEGRILPQETIVFGNNKEVPSGANFDWTNYLKTTAMLSCAEFKEWVIIYPANITQDGQNLVRMIESCGRGMGFVVPPPKHLAISNDGLSAYVQAIEEAVNRYNPQLVLCVTPNNRSDRYSAIKKKTIVNKSVPSQVVLLKNIRAKGAMSIASKITIQINCKIGGAPWGVKNPMKQGMVIGFDVCHDPRDKRRSYGAMVSSMDENFSRYFSAVNEHTNGDELSAFFKMNISKSVEKYRQVNGKRLPSPIILFRDGVGDGDLEYVYEVEIKDIIKALNSVYQAEGTPLRLAIVIVTKRINVRIFYNKKNPLPGTVIDDVITNPPRYSKYNGFDYFVVSQSVRHGTVSPTHYNVIYNTTGYPVDNFQRITYKLTHMYFNWSGTVRVPAPVQYAHKLAFLTAQSIGCQHSNLDRLLYFL